MNIFANKFDRELKSGIYINNNLINKCQEDQYLIWKCHELMIKIRHVFSAFSIQKQKFSFHFKSYFPRLTQIKDLLPGNGFTGHLSQM